MNETLSKFLEIGGDPFAPTKAPALLSETRQGSSNLSTLNRILSKKNGFFAFESALRVFPTISVKESWGLSDWNSDAIWRNEYRDSTNDLFFFAEDIFGGQFCLTNVGVGRFDPETADVSAVADDIDHWVSKLLAEYSSLTGYQTAHEWQNTNGPLPPRCRLMPKLPFVLGGTNAISNLVAIDSVRLMKNMGNLARQIHGLPDGTQIRFEVVR